MTLIVSWESKLVFVVTYIKKFPTLLEINSYFTKLIVLKSHEDVCLSGADSILNFVRSNLWITRGQQTVKKLLKSCSIWKIVYGKTIVPPGTPA